MSRSRWSIATCLLVCALIFAAAPSPQLNANHDPEILDAFGVMDPFGMAHIDGTAICDYYGCMFWLDGTPTSGYVYTDGSFELDVSITPGYHQLQVEDLYGMSEVYEMWIE